MKTGYKAKCEILADLWLNYRDDVEFDEFIQYNDLGLPLAYAVANGIVEDTEQSRKFIEETFELLLAGFEIEDAEFESLDDLLSATESDFDSPEHGEGPEDPEEE